MYKKLTFKIKKISKNYIYIHIHIHNFLNLYILFLDFKLYIYIQTYYKQLKKTKNSI